MMTLRLTLSDPQLPQTTPFSAFCTAIHSFVTGEPRDFKFGTLIYHSNLASPILLMKNLSFHGHQGQMTRFRILHPM